MRVTQIGIGLTLALLTVAAHAGTVTKQLAPGITLTQEIDQTPPLIINVLNVNLQAPGVRLGVDIGQDHVNGPEGNGGREEVSAAARRHGALAAVNGDFFAGDHGDPLGIGIQDGQLFSEPWWGDGKGGPRAAMGILDGGRRVIFDTLGFLGDLQAADGARARLNGINRRVGPGEIVAFTPLYGPTSGNRPGGTEVVLDNVDLPLRANKLMTGTVLSVTPHSASPQAIGPEQIVLSGGPGAGADFLAQHLKPGDQVEFVPAVAPPEDVGQAVQIAEMPRAAGDLPARAGETLNREAWLWGTADDALGGGPRLLTDGQVTLDGTVEAFDPWLVSSPQPRTAVGTTQDGHHLLIVTVDGRQALSQGVTLADLALILKRYGAWNAMNLDGGGSTAMAAAGLVVSNPPGDGSERAVAETLEVFSNRVLAPDRPAPPRFRLAIPAGGTVSVGSITPVQLLDGTHVISGNAPDVLWQGPVSGVGFMAQDGDFTAVKPGVGAITALYKGRLISGRITVTGATPAPSNYTLDASFAPGGDVNYDQLTIKILDQSGQPLANAPIHIVVTGGIADSVTLRTGADGYADVGITWGKDSGGSVTVTSGTFQTVTVPRPKL